MYMSRTERINRDYNTTDYLLSKARKIYHIAGMLSDKDITLNDAKCHELLSLLNESEYVCNVVRNVLATKIEDGILAGNAMVVDALTTFAGITIDISDNHISVITPPTTKRLLNDSGYLANAVSSVINDYILKNGNIKIELPVYIILTRYAPSEFGAKQTIKDNENLENSRIINSICRQLNINDAPCNAGFISKVVSSETPYAKIEVISLSKLISNPRLLDFKAD